MASMQQCSECSRNGMSSSACNTESYLRTDTWLLGSPGPIRPRLPITPSLRMQLPPSQRTHPRVPLEAA
jgi:hypothetical protein